MKHLSQTNVPGPNEIGSQLCDVSRSVVAPLQAAGIWEMFLSYPPSLRLKGQRDACMRGKQEAAEGV